MTDEELLAAFDHFNLVFITLLLLITWPLAIFVYAKLLLYPSYSSNYTFKLIVVNGITVRRAGSSVGDESRFITE